MRLSAFLRAILLHPSDPNFLSAVHHAAGEPPPQPKVGTFEALIRDYKRVPNGEACRMLAGATMGVSWTASSEI